MNRRLDKMRKLVRFREFRESLAVDAMRLQLVETEQATRALDQAQIAVGEAESWKARAFSGGSVDIGLYGVALENERLSTEHRDAAELELEASRHRCEEAGGRWREAASATRAARERTLAESRCVEEIREKRVFDQLGDLLLARKEERHD